MELAVDLISSGPVAPNTAGKARGSALPAGLRERVQSSVLTHEQTVPVATELASLFTERALVRGRTLACAGPAATSTGMAVVAAAVAGGAWLAVVDVPTFGLDAASELGIALERVVAVSVTAPAADDPSGANGASGPSSCVQASWVEVMAAVVDGFDIVLARVPVDAAAGPVRRLATRVRQRGAVVILLGESGAMPCDGVIDSGGIIWAGLGDGFGSLRQRTVELHLAGRRVPGRRQCRVTLPAVTEPHDADVLTPIRVPMSAEVCAS
ncbi:MAG: hypothetical protein ABWZ42_05160 [Ilumatobacteraceae bacterium]